MSGPPTRGADVRILIVDDEPDMRSGLRQILRRRGYTAESAGDVREAMELFRAEPFDVVLTDLMLPGGSGIEVLEQIKAEWSETLVILFTGYATVETAVEAIRKGAFDYIPKPFSPQQLEVVLQRALKQRALTEENRILLCPRASGAEAAWVGAAQVLAPQTLADVVRHFTGQSPLPPAELADAGGDETNQQHPDNLGDCAQGRTDMR